MPSLQERLHKRDPFDSPVHEAILSIVHTADLLARQADGFFTTFGLSPPQYNVLRILRGVGPAGLPCGQISQRMVTRDPDMTRLLDRLERRGLINRCRGDADRRIVQTRITPCGEALLARIDQPLTQLHQTQMAHLNADQILQLINLLAAARGGLPAESSSQLEGSS